MKPLKGMNLDVSADSQPPNTYRRARNWVYDDVFDALMQAPGYDKLSTYITGKHVLAHYAFEDGDVVFLAVDSTSETAGDSIYLYDRSAGTVSSVFSNTGLNFNRTTIYDIVGFRNLKDERVVVIGRAGEPPLAINIDLATQPAMDLQYLVPNRDYPYITLDSQTSGSLDVGTHFVAVRYEYEDGTVTTFGPPSGPYRLAVEGRGLVFSLADLDTNYARLQLGMITVANESINTRIVADRAITSADMNVYVEGQSYGELVLEDIIVGPQVYAEAQSVEYHDNRIYLGNVKENDEDLDTLQGYANQIQPIWEMRRGVTETANTRTDEDPGEAFFMPDEVYAFYISYVRSDGSRTRAYHIPGQPSKDVSVKFISNAAGSGPDYSNRNVDPTSTLTTLLGATGSGEANEDDLLDYLANDRNIFDSSDDGYDDIQYFHTRGTARAFTPTSDVHFGEMGYWENANEVYPSDFPQGVSYTRNSSGTVTASTSVTLAGQNVRHHRVPSIGWLLGEQSSTFDLDTFREHGFHVKFDFVRVPSGFAGCQIHFAKRTNANNLVLGHMPLHFGSSNSWSIWGEGGSDYQYYSSVSPINSRNGNCVLHTSGSAAGSTIGLAQRSLFNAAAGSPTQASGSSFSWTGGSTTGPFNSDGDAFSDFAVEFQDRLNVYYHRGLAYPQDMLAVKPALPDKMYTRFEYMLMQQEKAPANIEDYGSGTSSARGLTMSIADSTEDNFYQNAIEEQDSEGANLCRRSVFDFTSSGGLLVNRPQPASMILPCRNQRYMPAGVIDDEVEHDNRHAPEALYWQYKTITNSSTEYDQAGYHNAGDRLWYSVLNNPDTLGEEASGDTDDARYTSNSNTNHNRFGHYVQHIWSANGVRAVQRAPFVNVTAMRFDCYSGYELQDLVSCTGLITAGQMDNAPTINGVSQSSKTVPSSKTSGDVYHSKTQYRVTAPVGYNAGINSTDEASAASTSYSDITNRALVDLTADGTVSDIEGTQNVLMKVNTISPVASLLHNQDKDQHENTEGDEIRRPANNQNDNDMSIDRNLMRLNDWTQPVINDMSELRTSHKYRVARSMSQENTTSTLDFRVFAPLDYHEQPRNRGVITNLQSFADKLLIHHEQGLFLTVGKESVATTAGQVVLGKGDIFRVTPSELAPSDHGFAGTQHKESCILTPHGYFFVDADQGKVFLYNGKVQEISQRGLRGFFRDALKLRDDWHDAGNYGSVRSFYPGVHAQYDPVYNRVMLMIRNNIAGDSIGSMPLTASNYFGADGYTDSTEVISYSFNNNGWVSFHDTLVNCFVAVQDQLLGLRTATNSEMYDMNALKSGITYNNGIETKHLEIDIAFPANQSVQWQSFSWHTKAVEHVPGDDNAGHIDLNKTFVKAGVYNDYQCSGLVSFTKADAIDVTTKQRVTLRHNGTHYQFNGFRDLVSDRTLRFLDDNGDFVTSNIDTDKDWFSQRRFNSTHAVLRLQGPRDTTNLLYLYDVDAKVRKAYR